MPIIERPDDRVELIEVPPGTDAELVKTNSNADILCLDLHAYDFQQALDWIIRRQKFAVANYHGPASIAVMANSSRLKLDERRRISWELEPAGAKFIRWPDGCLSFGDAFVAFANSIGRTYQWPMVAAL